MSGAEFVAYLITDPWFYAAAIPAVLIVGVSKGGLGGGLGLLGVPLMALVISPVQAAAILLPILCAMDLVGLSGYRGQWSGRLMRILLPAATVGIGLGWVLFRWIDARIVELMIGFIALAFLLFQILRERILAGLGNPPHWMGWIWGGMAGFTSCVAHAGGPPLAIYLLPMRLDKTLFIATSVIFFALVNLLKIVPYYFLGQLDFSNLATALVLLPLAPIGVRLGMWLLPRISTGWFYRISSAGLALSAAKLIWDGLTKPGGLLAV